MNPNKKNIIIVGAGYAGIAAAKGFEKNPDFNVTLVDRRNYHLYSPNLYEVASAEEEFTTVADLKRSIALPIAEIFKDGSIKFKQAEVKEINPSQNFLIAGSSKINYDYLVLAGGAATEYYGIKGAKEFSMPLKTLTDALAVRNKLEFVFEAKAMSFKKDFIRLVVAGGGYTGCEFAAQLSDFVKILCWKYGFPESLVEVVIVEASSKLVNGLSDRLSIDVWERMEQLNVRVLLSSPIFSVEQNFVCFLSGEKMEYDALVWAAGVRGSAVLSPDIAVDKKGRALVNEFLQVKDHHNIFALGDIAAAVNKKGMPLPQTAVNAIEQGEYLAYALPIISKNQKPRGYVGKQHGLIVALAGRWAILKAGPLYMAGWLAFVVRNFVTLNYYRTVVGWWKAFKYVWLQWREYGRND